MNAATNPGLTIEALEDGTLDAGSFDHEGHIYMAWLYLDQLNPADAIGRFTGALRRLTALLGVPEKYHATISWMFVLLIEERRSNSEHKDWLSFRRDNDDLFADGIDVMQRYYSKELLWSDQARQAFVLPDRLAA
jgi:hypothetical protein